MAQELVQDEVKENIIEKKELTQIGQVYTTLFKDPLTSERHAIIGHHSPNKIVDNIIAHNNLAGYTAILNIGQSGTGKTTWTNYLVHQLHLKMPSVVIHKFSRNEIQKLDKIIYGLQKGVSHIIVFDDASFALEELKKEQLNNLAKSLTYIRHIVKGKVITVMNIHYDKAVKKFFRDVPFRFLTSISNEELGQYEDLFGSWAKYKLRDFARFFHKMMLSGGWNFELSKWSGKMLSFTTHRPFRLGLASEVNDLHYFMYLKDSCEICDPQKDSKKVISVPEFVENLINSYQLRDARAMLRNYSHTQKGIKVLTSRRQALWNTIAEYDKNNMIDWIEVNDYLDNNFSKFKRKRHYNKRTQTKDNIDSLNESQKAGQLDQDNNKQDDTGYDESKILDKEFDKRFEDEFKLTDPEVNPELNPEITEITNNFLDINKPIKETDENKDPNSQDYF